MSQIGRCTIASGSDFERWIEFNSFATLDIGQFQSEYATLCKFQATRNDEWIAGKGSVSDNVVEDPRRLWLVEQNLNGRNHRSRTIAWNRDGFGQQNTWARSSDHGSRLHHSACRRHVMANAMVTGLGIGKETALAEQARSAQTQSCHQAIIFSHFHSIPPGICWV